MQDKGTNRGAHFGNLTLLRLGEVDKADRDQDTH